MLGDVCIYVVGKDEYDELACKCLKILGLLLHQMLSMSEFSDTLLS